MASRGGKIRPPRRPMVRADENEFETYWGLLSDALRDIHTKNAGKLSFEHLYRASYKIVLRKKGEVLYDRVKQFEEKWFLDQVIPQIQALISKNLISITVLQLPGSSANERRQMGEKFLEGIRDAWEDHNMSMNMIADILMYLDRAYTQDVRRPSIFAATIGLFREHILRAKLGGVNDEMMHDFLIFDILNAVILDLINMERDGDVINRQLVKKCVSMLDDLYETDEEHDDQKLYFTVFEPMFIDRSRFFYQKECQKLVRESDASYWLRHTQRRLEEEQDRCATFLLSNTSDRIAEVVDKELISAHLDDFLAMEGSGLKSMIDNDREEDLAILYRLISRVDPSKAALKTALGSRIMDLGLEIERVLKQTDFTTVTTTTNAEGDGEEGGTNEGVEKVRSPAAAQTAAAVKWVDDVLRLKDKFDTLWRQCFSEDILLQSAMTRSFSEFINMFGRSSEFLSLYIDHSLKHGIKGKSEQEIDLILDKAIVLLRYLLDRDLFESYYRKHLARRLLIGKSESQDVEKAMISRMKQELGNTFTTKFEGMFKDMDLSRDLSGGYRDYIDKQGDIDKRRVELGISVLTNNFWPTEVMGRISQLEDGSRVECTYPAEIKRLQESFTKYYLKDRSGRVLTWVGACGNADIKCVFPAVPGEKGPRAKERRYEVNVSTYGMVILLLFEDLAEDASLTLEEIQAQTNIPAQDLKRHLISLTANSKFRLLSKEPAAPKHVSSGDKFSFNTRFVSKTIKIRVPIVNSTSTVEAVEERKETERKNDETRWHMVDAAIVRIMKQRKTLGHAQLISEVVTQLSSRFKPEISMVKRRIQDLLEREFLERDDSSEQSGYRYLA